MKRLALIAIAVMGHSLAGAQATDSLGQNYWNIQAIITAGDWGPQSLDLRMRDPRCQTDLWSMSTNWVRIGRPRSAATWEGGNPDFRLGTSTWTVQNDRLVRGATYGKKLGPHWRYNRYIDQWILMHPRAFYQKNWNQDAATLNNLCYTGFTWANFFNVGPSIFVKQVSENANFTVTEVELEMTAGSRARDQASFLLGRTVYGGFNGGGSEIRARTNADRWRRDQTWYVHYWSNFPPHVIRWSNGDLIWQSQFNYGYHVEWPDIWYSGGDARNGWRAGPGYIDEESPWQPRLAQWEWSQNYPSLR
jgi:hypothetical protein